MQAYIQQQQNNLSGDDHEKTSLTPITTEKVCLCSPFSFTSKKQM